MKQKLHILSFILFFQFTLFGQVVTTIAGSGAQGSVDATGTAARFSFPTKVAVDNSGNVYVADQGNQKIRKITSTGVVTTFAGSGAIGSVDATGTAASFNYPRALAFDGLGNLYVADTFNNKIRKITSTGVVTTLAGSGTVGSVDATGTAASFNNPYGIAVDGSGNVYVADSFNHKIRKITSAGVVTTFAGSGAAGSADATGIAASFNVPFDVTFDSAGNLYVADRNNHKIRKITSVGVVTSFAGSGAVGSADAMGTAASFDSPRGVAVDGLGYVYVADNNNHKIRKITPAGIVTTYAGSGASGSTDAIGTAASFFSPFGVAVDGSGNLYVADNSNHKIRKIAPLPATHLNFDGTNDVVDLGSSLTTYFTGRTQVSIQAWVRPETNSGLGVIVGNYNYPSNVGAMQMMLRRDNGNYTFYLDSGSGFTAISAVGSVVVNSWQHVTGTWDGTTMKIYVNGVLANSAAKTGTIPSKTTSFSIGANVSERFDGDIDEVRIWNVALTASQINASKNCELAGTESGLVAYYNFNQGNDQVNNSTITTLNALTGSNGALLNFALTGTTSNWLAGSLVTTGIIIPAAPTATSQSFCGSATVANLVPAPSSIIKWYNSTTSTTALNSTDALTSGTYYVAGVNTNSCESARTAVSIVVNLLPVAPTASSQSFCGAALVANLAPAPSSTIKWYSSSTSTTALNSSDVITTATYYAAAVNSNGCESARTAVSIVVNSIPTSPTAPSPQVYVGVLTTIADLTATGSNLKWYIDRTGGYALATTQSLWVSGSPLYVSQTNNGCESERIPVTVQRIGESTQTLCNPATVANLASTPSVDGTAQWFTQATGGASLGSAATLTAGTYYVQQSTPTVIEILGSRFSLPEGVAIQTDGKIVVVDTYNHVVKRMDADGSNIEILGSGFNYPSGVAIQTDGKIVIADTFNNYIKRMNADGTSIETLGSGFLQPFGVAIQSDGKIVVVDYGNRAIKRMNADGTNIETIVSGNYFPVGVTIQPDGKIVIADTYNNYIKRITETTNISNRVAVSVDVTNLSNDITQNLGVITATENDAFATYQWYQCPNILLDGETNQSFTPTSNGDYKVEITKGNCMVSSVCETFLNTNSFEMNIGLKIYPNPSTGIFTIAINEDALVEVHDMLGKVIYTNKVKAGNNTIDISNYQSGIYLLNISNENGLVTKKIIKE